MSGCAGAVTKPSTQKRLAQALENNELPKLVDLRSALNMTLTSDFPQMRALGSAMGSNDPEKLQASHDMQRKILKDGLRVRFRCEMARTTRAVSSAVVQLIYLCCGCRRSVRFV